MKRYKSRKRAALLLAAVIMFASLTVLHANGAQLQSEQTFGHISEHKAFYDTYGGGREPRRQGEYPRRNSASALSGGVCELVSIIKY